MEDFWESLDNIWDPNQFLIEKEIDEGDAATAPTDFEIMLQNGSDFNEQFAERETQKLITRLQIDHHKYYPDARVCIFIAIWRADDVLKIIEQEEDAYISLRDMFSKLKWEWIINRFTERETIRLYRWWWVLWEKYRSKVLDVLINKWLIELELEPNSVLPYLKFRDNLTY